MAMFFEEALLGFDPGSSSHQESLADPYPSLLPIITPPPTLRWALGAGGKSSSCSIVFDITNSGNTTVQIPYGGVRLKKAPQRNDFQYRLVNVCTLLPPPRGGYSPSYGSMCRGSMGSSPGTHCGAYSMGIDLNDAKEGFVFSKPIGSAYREVVNGETKFLACPTLTLSSGQSTVLSVYFSSLSSSPLDNLIYSLVPELMLSTSSGSHILTLPQLEVTVAFAKESQISCYGLQGNLFVLEEGGPFGKSGSSWCL